MKFLRMGIYFIMNKSEYKLIFSKPIFVHIFPFVPYRNGI